MREIKFRAWMEEEKEMYFSPEMGTEFDNRETISFWQHLEDMQVAIDDVILMQFTGLKDKNGKEIYEGDIVEYLMDFEYFGRCYKKENTEVIFENGMFIVRFDDGFDNLVSNDQKTLTVVGNIYENPELLKSKLDNK